LFAARQSKTKSFFFFLLQCSRLFFALKAKRQSRARTSDFVALDALRRFCPLAGVEEGTPTRQSKTKSFSFSFALLSFICTSDFV